MFFYEWSQLSNSACSFIEFNAEGLLRFFFFDNFRYLIKVFDNFGCGTFDEELRNIYEETFPIDILPILE